MPGRDADRYEAYYADKLWDWLPAVHRADDGDAGPLRELVARVGTQAAVLRRSIDRLWEGQSIETSDDWLIPYLGDLLATNLVASLDARGQRLDVAKTIYYRRRKGTVGVLEEIAGDITGWDARVVEFFRRLGRTRHGLDPEIGRPADTAEPHANRELQIAQGLVGPLTGTAIGGYADLRHVYGATKGHSAFDEYFHTADVRRPAGVVGWYDVARLGAFAWRLYSFGVALSTPVQVADCAQPRHFAFDPTGRLVPLFARSSRAFGDRWASPEEWQLPTPISSPLFEAHAADLYPASLEVFHRPGSFWDALSAPLVTVYPELGRFAVDPSAQGDPLAVAYHYGFSSTIGAGPYDRRVLGRTAAPAPEPVTTVSGGGNALAGPLGGLGATGTVRAADSLTYDTTDDVGDATPIHHVRVDSTNRQRPVVRRPSAGAEWSFTGAADGVLELDGFLVTGGCDVVLRGEFDTVTVSSTTLDPGQWNGATPPDFATAVDGSALAPSRLWIEGMVRLLRLERCIAASVRTRGPGAAVERVELTDSIVQAIRTDPSGALSKRSVKDPTRLLVRLRDGAGGGTSAPGDPLSAFLHGELSTATQAELAAYSGDAPPKAQLLAHVLAGLNAALAGPSLYDPGRFARVELSAPTLELAASNPAGADLLRLNRLLLEEAYPIELADLALGFSSGAVSLTRTTVIGPAFVHRLDASECILDDRVLVEDAQHGCVRFSAWSSGSVLPRQYECVEVAPGAPLFTTRSFGQPGYCQLLQSADRQIVSGGEHPTIREGGPQGGEMGVFASELDAVKHRSIRLKYDEFMPLGLDPVVIEVT